MEIKSYFPTPILYHQVEEHIANLVEELIIPRINKLEKKDTLKTDFFSNSKILSLLEIPSLMKEIDKSINYYCKLLNINIPSLADYWVQDYKKNDFHQLHNHGRCEISIVYWIRANQYSGNIRILNPSPYNKIYYPNGKPTIFTGDSIQIPPTKGKLIIFPSFLDHEVLPSGEGCVRTTLALNYQ